MLHTSSVPKWWPWSRTRHIHEGNRVVAVMRLESESHFRIELGDVHYDGTYASGVATLVDQRKQNVATAQAKQRGLGQSLTIRTHGHEHSVDASFANAIRGRYPLATDGVQAGEIRAAPGILPKLRGEWIVDLPDAVPLYLRVFMLQVVWLSLPRD